MAVSEEELRKLSVEQRLHLIDALWNSLSNEIEHGQISQAHAEELDRRLLDEQQNPNDFVEWSEVEAMLLSGTK